MADEMNEDEVLQEPVDPTQYLLPPEDLPSAENLTGEDAIEYDELPAPPEFDPKYRRDFEGLLYIGKVSRTIKWLGHTFILRSMTIDEILEIGQLHQPYANTVADIKAWQALTIAACLVSLDGKPIALPVGEGSTTLESKFNYIKLNWYPWVLDKLYEQYLLLDSQVAEVIEAMGKA